MTTDDTREALYAWFLGPQRGHRGLARHLEALWIARNLAYLPVAASGAAQALGVTLEVDVPGGGRERLDRLGLWELLNISNAATLDLWGALWASAPPADVKRALHEHSLNALGYQEYMRRLTAAFGDPLPAGVVLVAATAHYSWEKIVRALGIGSNQLVYVPVDVRYRMDPDALWRTVLRLTERRVPIQACVSVCGTTEESAVDRLDLVLEVRRRAERELGVSYHIHSDAAYGGYAAAVTRNAEGRRRPAEEIRAEMGTDWPSDEWVAGVAALGEADSVTIDPHKLGYIPYPAGAFLLKERRARQLVAIDPGARLLYGALADEDLGEFHLVLLPEPDINIVCWVVAHPSLNSLEELNGLNERIYAQMSLGRPGAAPDYIITRTRFQTPMYDGAVDPVLERLGVCTPEEWKASGPEGLVVLRSTVMDPFLAAERDAGLGGRGSGGAASGSGSSDSGTATRMGTDHSAGFVRALARACEASLG